SHPRRTPDTGGFLVASRPAADRAHALSGTGRLCRGPLRSGMFPAHPQPVRPTVPALQRRSTMKRLYASVLFAGLLVLAGSVNAHEMHSGAHEGVVKTLTGELVDTGCY